MKDIGRLAEQQRVQAALAAFTTDLSEAIDLAIAIQQIPAPTFAEAKRAAFMESRFHNLGLKDVFQDPLHNVYGRIPGRTGGAPVVVSAHLDTVFSADTDLNIRREQRQGRELIYGPGLADNATGLAGLLLLGHALQRFELWPLQDIWLVANVAEEGLGDLKGMRAVVNHFQEAAAYIVVEGGSFGQIFHRAISSRRFRLVVKTAGGHSWGNFGTPNAIHILGHLIAAIDQIQVPTSPKTTYNVGQVEGGLSINTIAPSAAMLLDLRSVQPEALADLTTAVETIVGQYQSTQGVTITMTKIGDRPAGQVPKETPLIQAAAAALQAVGQPKAAFLAGSTDANIPISRGFPAVCIGLASSGNTHRVDEFLDPKFLAQGLGQLLLLSLSAAGLAPDQVNIA